MLQLSEECLHLICFLAAVSKSGKPKSVGKSIIYGLNRLRNLKQGMLFAILPIITVQQKAKRLSLQKWFRYGTLV